MLLFNVFINLANIYLLKAAIEILEVKYGM